MSDEDADKFVAGELDKVVAEYNAKRAVVPALTKDERARMEALAAKVGLTEEEDAELGLLIEKVQKAKEPHTAADILRP